MILSTYRIKKSSFYDIIIAFGLSQLIDRSGALQILKNKIRELMTEKLTKINTRGIGGNKSNNNSSNRMDLTFLLQNSLYLENDSNNSFITLLILLVL